MSAIITNSMNCNNDKSGMLYTHGYNDITNVMGGNQILCGWV